MIYVLVWCYLRTKNTRVGEECVIVMWILYKWKEM